MTGGIANEEVGVDELLAELGSDYCGERSEANWAG